MIIYPKNVQPVPVALAPIYDIMLFPFYQSREDAKDLPPSVFGPPDPYRRTKKWYDPAYAGMEEDDGEVALYTVIHTNPQTGKVVVGDDGKPRITTLVLSRYEAGRLNIPEGTANEFPPSAPINRIVPFPIRQLHPDEELVLSGGFVQNVMVRNKRLASLPDGVFTAEDRQILYRIASKLGVL